MRALPSALLLVALGACASDPQATAGVVGAWTYDTPTDAAPPGVGPEGRTVVLVRDAATSGGQLITLDQSAGSTIEGPFDGAPLSDHAPLMVDATIFVLNKIGGLVGLDLAGEVRWTLASPTPSATSALVAAPDGRVCWGTAAGELVCAAADGTLRFRASLGDPIVSAPAVGADGRVYGATDTGRVVGVDATGAVVFEVRVDAPASGPSVGPGGEVAVGEAAGLRVFTAGGAEKWRHTRAARVVGTSWTADRVVAWGEDGVVERLGATGTVELSFKTSSEGNPAPVYVAPVALGSGALGVLDAAGTAHVVGSDGASLATLALGGAPLREATAAGSRMYVAIGRRVHALLFVDVPSEPQ